MDVDTTSQKLPWETPASIALTEPESRADQVDIAMRNGFVTSFTS